MGLFISSCGLYHFGEYMYKCKYQFWGQDDKLSWHDFQIDHSWAYLVAMGLCFAEYGFRKWVTSVLYPKFHLDVNILG